MPKELELLVWRAASRSLDLADSISDLAETVGSGVPLENLWIFGLDDARCSLLASWSRDGAVASPFAVRGEDAASVARFVAKGGLATFDPSRPARSLLRPLARALGIQPVLCGALRRSGVAEGVVALRPRSARLDERIGARLGAVLEPLAVAVDHARRFRELESLRRAAEADGQAALQRLGRSSLEDPIVGASGGLRPVLERVDLVARSDLPALILGETGSGKEVIARAIHERSVRQSGPFLRVNCGAIPPELIDSELFGHEKGAFTGATERRKGWFERADGGTLFLDEVGELPPAAQVRLLRVTQEGTFERVGGQETVRVDCRIVAATHRDLAAMVRERTFREDLWYRIAIFPIFLPPLRERPEDLGPLASLFARRAAVRFGLPTIEPLPEDLALLGSYDWPGNVRELQAIMDRAVLLGGGRRLAIGVAMGWADREAGNQVGVAAGPAPEVRPRPVTLDDAVREHVRYALRRCGGRIEGPRGAAKFLGVNPHTLRSKMRRLGIEWKAFRPSADPIEPSDS